jgi:flotillin
MARSLPPMMQIMRDIGGVELPEYIARFHQEGKHAADGAAAKAAENGKETTVPPKG